MKKLLFSTFINTNKSSLLIFSVFILSLFSINPNLTLAATCSGSNYCSEMTVNPRVITPETDSVTVNMSGCPDNVEHRWAVYDNFNNNLEDGGSVNGLSPQGTSFSFNIPASVFGIYSDVSFDIKVLNSQFDTSYCQESGITVSEEVTSEDVVLNCGDIRPSSSTLSCPSICPQVSCQGSTSYCIGNDYAQCPGNEDLGTVSVVPQNSLVKLDLCKQAGSLREDCETCMGVEGSRPGLWTAFGCINTGSSQIADSLASSFFRVALGVSGGAALLLILYGSFNMSTSSGDPERLKKAQETITSSIMGLVFIILSAVILRFIGLDLLQLPSF